ncbi:maltase 1-like [Coccinella septempunctata]|uniref:maltase 1-like n=1 Tax=Coccinella septempunctata TaxID=41139 RepID=UPI001D07B8B8|nr:maltase 1-like [Coccinella septempunctata]
MFILWLNIFTILLGSAISVPVRQGDQDWWKHGVFYQIYPRSFKDSNNDGDGDLQGILDKMEHFADAGITGVWLSPIMKSPQIDAGYDISDYYDVDPMYGSMDDLKRLIKRAHDLGLRIILDFVPNHTSDQHEWFKASENRTEGYEDFYVWVDGTPDKPPNNWRSVFRNSAWTWSEKRNQWYLRQFLAAQPDLNFWNPKVREALWQVLIFYMDMGIDGFRVDAVPYFVEDKLLRDEPRSYDPNSQPEDHEYLDHIYTMNTDDTFDVLYEFREVVDNYTREHGGDARILMSEAYAPLDKTMRYYGTADGSRLGAHFTFNFFFVGVNLNSSDAYSIENLVYTWIDNLPSIYVSNWDMGNHDNRRVTTRFGVENVDGFNMLLNLLPGIGVTYYGEEIGQEDGEVTYEQGKDPAARNRSTFYKVSRDFERTPFQWDDTVNAGFNEGHDTWLPVSEKYHETNLAAQKKVDGLSHYKIYKEVLRKRQEDTARIGDSKIWSLSEDLLVLKRSLDNRHIVLAFKLGWHNHTTPETAYVPGIKCDTAKVALTNVNSSYQIGDMVDPSGFVLEPHDSIVLDIAC